MFYLEEVHPLNWVTHPSDSKESTCKAGELGSIPGLGGSPGEGNNYPLQYSGLENSTDRGAWQATGHGLQRVRCDWVTFTSFHPKTNLWLNELLPPPHHKFSAMIWQWFKCTSIVHKIKRIKSIRCYIFINKLCIGDFA